VIISNDNVLGYKLPISDIGKCYEYNNGNNTYKWWKKCNPIISSTSDINYRYQDNYKWDMVYDVLKDKIYSRNSNSDNASIITDNRILYITSSNNVLTINFMNIARVSNEKGWLSWW